MAFGNEFSKAFTGSDNFKDYQHASKTFRSAGYELAPRSKFNFHVVFSLNTGEIPQLANIIGTSQTTYSLLVKSVQLPVFQINVDEMNQYNRKRLVKTNISYQPVQITFHDDSADNIRMMWYNYFSYHFNDPNNSTTLLLGRDIYSNNRNNPHWGVNGTSFDNGTKPAFFRDITVYAMSQQKFASYTLVNPMITDWQHDTHDYSESSGAVNTATVKYETVKYASGSVSSGNITGFADPSHYDTERSALSRGGTSANILDQGGLLHAGASIFSDLQEGSIGSLLNAARTAGTTANTFKNADIGKMVNAEGTSFLAGSLQSTLRGSTAGGFLNTQVSSLIPAAGSFNFASSMSEGIAKVQSVAKPADVFAPTNAKLAPSAFTNAIRTGNSL
jgi:hypothetical protein